MICDTLVAKDFAMMAPTFKKLLMNLNKEISHLQQNSLLQFFFLSHSFEFHFLAGSHKIHVLTCLKATWCMLPKLQG